MRSLRFLGALVALLGAASAHGQSRVERVEVESSRFGRASYCRQGARWTRCGSDREPDQDVLALAIEYGLGTRVGGERTPPRRARFVESWLRHRWQSPRTTWGTDQPLRWGGRRRVEVSPDRRHVFIRESHCGAPGCDCATDVVVDATWDGTGRLQRFARMTTTCECADSILMDDTLRWDESGRLVGVRRGRYEHPFCRMRTRRRPTASTRHAPLPRRDDAAPGRRARV